MPKRTKPVGDVQLMPKPYARLLIADDIRVENTGKLFTIGLYADSVVVFRVPKNSPQPSVEQPFGMDSLSLLVVVGGFVGDETVRLTLTTNKPIEMNVSLTPGASANLLIPIKPFTFATFGVKVLLVEFAGTKHELQFEVRAEYIEPVEDLSTFLATVTRPMALRTTPVGGESASNPSAKVPAKRSRRQSKPS